MKKAAAPVLGGGPSFTFSNRARVANCPDSERLTHVKRPPSDDAERGLALDKYLLLDVPRVGVKAALALVPPQYQEECAQLDVEELGLSNPAKWATQVAIAYNPETGEARELSRGSAARDYSDVPRGWVAGTADAVGLAPGMVVLPDLKTGGADQGPPGEAEQLAGYGTAFAALHQMDHARVGFLLAPPGKAVRFVWDDLDKRRLAEEREKLLAEVRAVDEPRTGPLRLVEGAWCRYCPARDSCPAKSRHVAALALGRPMDVVVDGTFVRTAVLAFTEGEAAVALERVKDGVQLLEEVREALKERSVQSPILLASGKVWGAHRVQRDVVLDMHALREELERLLGVDGADVAAPLSYSFSKERLRKALKLSGNSSKEHEARVLAALRENGLERTEQVRFEAFTPGDME